MPPSPLLRAVLFLFAALLCSAARCAEPDRTPDIDRLFETWNRPDVPGGAVGVVREGKLIYAKGFGAADLETQTPITPQTVFEIASASKGFTCACIALLMDQGKISPDDELSRWVPEMHKFDPPIRIRHLVGCRTGLWEPVHIMPLAGWDNLPVQSPYSKADVFAVLCGQKRLPFEPGERFHYASGDYFLLGLIVERASGKSLAEFARENLFKPLGMTRTLYEEDPTRIVKGRAVGHYRQDGAWRQWRMNAYMVGGCGVKTCIEDLARWDQNCDDNKLPLSNQLGKHLDELLREGTLLGNRHVLDADAYRKYTHPKIDNGPAGQYRGLARIQFTGGVWGMTAAISRFPQERITVICLSNNDELSPFAKTTQIAELYLADKMKTVPVAQADEPEEPAELPLAELENKVGAYRLLEEGRIWKVRVVDGALHVVDPLEKAWKLLPLSSTRFRPAADSPFYKSARFTFGRASPQERYSMTLSSQENGFREVLDFQRVELAEPTPEKLAGYAGTYESDELPARYEFAVREGALWLRLGSRRWERLDPTVADEFIPHERTQHDNRIITFRRSGERITGFSIAFWRVQGVEFKRR